VIENRDASEERAFSGKCGSHITYLQYVAIFAALQQFHWEAF